MRCFKSRRYLASVVTLLTVSLLLSATALNATTFTVTTTNDSGLGSLRQAILGANASPNPANEVDTIAFNLASGLQVIAPNSPLPAITEAVIIDGSTQPGFSQSPVIVLDGTHAGPGANGLWGKADLNVFALTIRNFSSYGIEFDTGGGFSSCVVIGNGNDGVHISGASIDVGTNSYDDPLDGNQISGNGGHGIAIVGSMATGNYVEGNTISQNGGSGIDIEGAANNNIGIYGYDGYPFGQGNVIAQNHGDGITIVGNTAQGNKIGGNSIGTNAAGTVAAGNLGNGIRIQDAPSNEIGIYVYSFGIVSYGNTISGNNGDGILITGAGAIGNSLIQNFIGTNAAGTAALPNGLNGVEIKNASKTAVGEFIPYGGFPVGFFENGNSISGNRGSGIVITGCTGVTVRANAIGTNKGGRAALGNGRDGIQIKDSTKIVVGSYFDGHFAYSESPITVSNRVAFNGGNGVAVISGPQSLISFNDIYSNGKLGIAVNDTSVPPGGNSGGGIVTVPVLTAAARNAATSQVTVAGHFHGAANSPVRVELFASPQADPSGFGEGQAYLGAVQAQTDARGDAEFSAQLKLPAVNYQSITATATVENRTSEFSRAARIPFDLVAPVVTFSYPTNGTTITSLPYVAGQVSDVGSGVLRVVFYLRRLSDGLYWSGTAWQKSPLALPTVYDGSALWVRRFRLPQGQELRPDTYRLDALAVDRTGNRATASITVKVAAALVK